METIICATDFSNSSRNAVSYAVELAALFKSRLILLNAYYIPVPTFEGGYYPMNDFDFKKASEEGLNQLKNEILKKHASLEVQVDAELGFAFEAIKEAIKEYDADVLVMGISGGKNKIKEYIVGSTSLDAAKGLTIPTFIIPENTTYKKIKHIAYACDYAQDIAENNSLIQVKYFAYMFDAKLSVIHVQKPGEEISNEKFDIEMEAEEKLQRINHINYFISENSIEEGLQNFIDAHQPDLLIINPKKHNLIHRLFAEHVTRNMIFQSSVPLLCIHG